MNQQPDSEPSEVFYIGDPPRPKMQWRITDMLFLMAIVAVVSIGLSYLGLSNVLGWVGLLASSALTGTVVAFLLYGRLKTAVALSFAGLLGPVFLCLIFPPLIFNALVLLFFSAFAMNFDFSARTYYRVGLSSLALTFTLFSLIPTPLERSLAELQEKYPIQSLEDRLDYEPAPGDLNGYQKETEVLRRNDRLEYFDGEFNSSYESYAYERWGSRQYMLATVHDRQYQNFIKANGFGVVRMMHPHEGAIRYPALQDIPFKIRKRPTPQGMMDHDRAQWAVGDFSDHLAGLGHTNALADFNRMRFYDFLLPESMGHVPSLRKAAGFIPHAFHSSVENLETAKQQWSLTRLELVSLNRFDQPRVYVLDHLPRMDQLSADDIQTRALNDFEKAGLAKLKEGSEIYSREPGTRKLLMVGALRASRSCLRCHVAERGDMLGAFSYVFEEAELLVDDSKSEIDSVDK